MGSDRVVAERYELLEEIGSGGQGTVWRARDLRLKRLVALKCAKEDSRQLAVEAEHGAAFSHPNVVRVYDLFEEDGRSWVAQEYFASTDLAALVAREGPLSPGRAARIGAQVAAALARMHSAEKVHRDVTPANVLVGEADQAKLSDLGITRWAEQTQASGGTVDGTPRLLDPHSQDGGGPPAEVTGRGPRTPGAD
ncbi:serine/threonine protein kinase [Crossiella equi]|uniref:Serine/threonine protein kinase n=1 Tax=Crossiella equi TaxID=130796 RepID=A0ABS5ARL2_9PSEU|nr:serine/threonine-protein kinase [Crossiella equi]MBP2479022.1 serine/threonine protein kinase [Crossiella equi]